MNLARHIAQRPPGEMHHPSLVHDRVLLVLVSAAIAAAGLPFLTVAPNRLMSGTDVSLAELMQGWRALLLLPAGVLSVVPFLRPTRNTGAAAVLAASLALAGLVWLAGDGARHPSAHLSDVARVSPGAGFWVLAMIAWFAAANALEALLSGRVARILASTAIVLPVVALLGMGELDQLALLKEYANRKEVFEAAWWRHLAIVLATLLPCTLAGIPLGIAAARNERFATVVYSVLSIIQTVPSIALFGLLIAPLAWLAALFPGSGIRGVGLLPAVIGLTAYALLPIVHGTASSIRQVPSVVVEAALAMGFTKRQLFWKIEAPLALPALLSGFRVTAVQIVGLAVVAALIGAGGLGGLVFQGLASGALDLVMLGVLPVVATAVAVDAVFRILTSVLEDRRP